MAEKGAEGGCFREIEDLNLGLALAIEDDDPWAALEGAGRCCGR